MKLKSSSKKLFVTGSAKNTPIDKKSKLVSRYEHSPMIPKCDVSLTPIIPIYNNISSGFVTSNHRNKNNRTFSLDMNSTVMKSQDQMAYMTCDNKQRTNSNSKPETKSASTLSKYLTHLISKKNTIIRKVTFPNKQQNMLNNSHSEIHKPLITSVYASKMNSIMNTHGGNSVASDNSDNENNIDMNKEEELLTTETKIELEVNSHDFKSRISNIVLLMC